MKLVIASDHAGVKLKNKLCDILSKKYELEDASPLNTPMDDYPDFAFKVGNKVAKDENSLGILICGTGVGMSIAANKVKGIRCALVTDEHSSKYARRDDDANIIALPSTIDIDLAVACCELFINTEFCTDEEKYYRRKKKVLDYESGEYNEL